MLFGCFLKITYTFFIKKNQTLAIEKYFHLYSHKEEKTKE